MLLYRNYLQYIFDHEQHVISFAIKIWFWEHHAFVIEIYLKNGHFIVDVRPAQLTNQSLCDCYLWGYLKAQVILNLCCQQLMNWNILIIIKLWQKYFVYSLLLAYLLLNKKKGVEHLFCVLNLWFLPGLVRMDRLRLIMMDRHKQIQIDRLRSTYMNTDR